MCIRDRDKRIRAVGVFVNAPMEEILELAGHREKERVIDPVSYTHLEESANKAKAVIQAILQAGEVDDR